MPIVRVLQRPVKNDNKFFEIPQTGQNGGPRKEFSKNNSSFSVNATGSPTKNKINYALLTSKAQKSLA